jgi:hypothetical protein
VAADLTRSKRELLLFCLLLPQQDNQGASFIISVSVS